MSWISFTMLQVVLEDDSFFSGEKMSDIYVKGWLKVLRTRNNRSQSNIDATVILSCCYL